MSKDQTDVSHIDKGEINEPVAVRYCFDGYGYLYMDAGSGSDWASRVKDCEFLYTHPPMRELTEAEILEVWKENYGDVNISNFARSIIKASKGEK
jgi:hypothetical protein